MVLALFIRKYKRKEDTFWSREVVTSIYGVEAEVNLRASSRLPKHVADDRSFSLCQLDSGPFSSLPSTTILQIHCLGYCTLMSCSNLCRFIVLFLAQIDFRRSWVTIQKNSAFT